MKLYNIVLLSLLFCFCTISCYDVDVEVTRKQPNGSSSEEHIDLTTSDSEDELIAYIESLRQKKDLEHQDVKENTEDPSSSSDSTESEEANDTFPMEEDWEPELIEDKNTDEEQQVPTSSDTNFNSDINYSCSNPYLPSFIEMMSTQELQNLSDLIDGVCNNKNYIQFFNPDFGWQGDPKDRKKYTKFLKEEQVDSSTKYEFVVGMKFLLPRLKPSYVNDVFKAYTDNDWFASNYIHPDNMDVRIVSINTPINEHGFDIVYHMIMNFNVLKLNYAIKFKSNFIATKISENFTVFTERSLPNKQMKRRHISFLDTSGPLTSFTVFEYRQIDSFGLVGIAKDFMEKMDSSMMKAVYDNALIQTKK